MARRWVRIMSIVAVSVLLASVPAFAQDEDETEPGEFGNTGPYVGLLGGYAYNWNGDLPVFPGVPSTTQSSGSPQVGIKVGYRVKPPLAVELQLDYLTGANATANSLAGSYPPPFPPGTTNAAFQVEALEFTPNIRMYLLPGRIQPYAVVGVGLMWTKLTDFNSLAAASFGDRSEVSTLVRMGGGLAIRVDEAFSLELGAEYMKPLDGNRAFDHVSFNGTVVYQF